MKNKSEQFDEILQILNELKDSKKSKLKDFWDKMGILGQLISGILLVALGLYVTWSIDKAQKNLAKQISDSQIISSKDITEAQIRSSKDIADSQIKSSKDIADSQSKSSKEISAIQVETQENITKSQVTTSREIADAQTNTSKDIAEGQNKFQESAQQLDFDTKNRQIAAGYLEKLMSSSPSDRATLLDHLDFALVPKYSVPLAIRFTRPVQVDAEICNGIVKTPQGLAQQNKVMNNTAIALLRRLASANEELIRNFTASTYPPDAAIAEAALGMRSRVMFRVSNVDDYATIMVNDKFLGRYQLGREGDWVEITDFLDPKLENHLYVTVENGPYEGTAVRIELQAGAEQSDLSVRRNDWTVRGEAFLINFGFSLDSQQKFHLNNYTIYSVGEKGENHCS